MATLSPEQVDGAKLVAQRETQTMWNVPELGMCVLEGSVLYVSGKSEDALISRGYWNPPDTQKDDRMALASAEIIDTRRNDGDSGTGSPSVR